MDKTISSMKKSWILLFLLIIVISTTGCSTTPSSTTPSSTTPNSISSKYSEILHANFCVGADGSNYYVTFEPPLVQSGVDGVMMPLKPGKYKITVTTSTPEAAVIINVRYKAFIRNDKFGNPEYESVSPTGSWGKSDRYADYNSEILIPDDSIDGGFRIFDNSGPKGGHNCGTVIVTRLMV